MKIICENLTKTYKIKKGLFCVSNLTVVKNLNYEIKQGEIIAIMGMANSGKSTIVKLLSGREKPSFGRVYVEDGRNLEEISEIISDFKKRKINENDSVYNVLVSFGNKFKIDYLAVEKKIVDLRDSLDMDKIINEKIGNLSELDKIKVQVAISMLKSPAVLYFDNALVGLDSITKITFLKLLKRINKEFKTTIVIVSVDLMDIDKICKRVSVVQNGMIVVDGDYEKIKEKYWKQKLVSIIFNKSYMVPKGDFEIVEMGDYFLKIKIDFEKCDFGSFIRQFDVNSIIDINISNVPLINL